MNIVKIISLTLLPSMGSKVKGIANFGLYSYEFSGMIMDSLRFIWKVIPESKGKNTGIMTK